jgi:hypothetical protein
MVMVHDARRGRKPHWLGYVALELRITPTLAITITAGLAYGVVGANVTAWPAPAPVISYALDDRGRAVAR